MTDSPESSTSSSRQQHDRHIRVFISSTFKDMHEEREFLVKKVFPELRRICADRFVTFTEVDLRWGITEEQAAEGKVLPICLEEIHRCRPYFIGLLGERYGWIPESVPREVIENEPWLQEHVGQQTSVTELEILHGVLNNPEMAGHAFFYFRDPAYVKAVPENDRKNFLSENSESAEKLKKLKGKIRKSGLPVLDNYSTPSTLAETIRDQFIALIDRLYPKEEAPDPLDQEAQGHEAYGLGKLLAYVERPEHTAALDYFALSPSSGQGLALTGESGCGKTALLASWVKHWKEFHPEDYMFVHYFGATPESASVTNFLYRILGELKRSFGIFDEIPTDPDELREALPLWLAHTVGKGRFVLVLDALNQIEGNVPDRGLAWFPRHFPDHIRCIASTLPGPGLDTIKGQGWAEHLLPLVDMTERSRIIRAFLKHYRKTLNVDLDKQLTNAPGSANPLFLRTVLEEIRQFGSFEHLPDRICYYLEAQSTNELFRKVLQRWQEDFGHDLVSNTFSHLWAARQGLSESEWLDLLGTGEQSFPRQLWTPFFLAMESHLSQRSGVWAFGHDFLRQAAKTKFLPSNETCIKAHIDLANYFERQSGMTPRKVAEWPWQLHAAGNWNRLESCLTDKNLFLALYNDRTKWELATYWHPLRARGINLGQRYATVFDQWPKIGEGNEYELSIILGVFLRELAYYSEAKEFIQHALKGFEETFGFDDPKTLSAMEDLAILIDITEGAKAESERLSRRAMEGFERVFGEYHPRTLKSMGLLASMLSDFLDLTPAIHLSLRATEGLEKTLGKDHLDTLKSKWSLAVLKNDYHMLSQAAQNIERVLGPDHPETLMIFANFIGKYKSEKAYDQAAIIAKRCYDGFNRLLGPEHNLTFEMLTQLSELYVLNGDYNQAKSSILKVIEGYNRLNSEIRPRSFDKIRNIAWKLFEKGDYDLAKPLYQYVFEGYEQALGMGNLKTLSTAKNLAALLIKLGDNKQAEQVYQQVLEYCDRAKGEPIISGMPILFDIFHDFAVLHQDNRDYASAEPLARRALEGCAKLSQQFGRENTDIDRILGNYISCLEAMGFTRTEAEAKATDIMENPEAETTLNVNAPEEDEMISDLITDENLTIDFLKSIYDAVGMETKVDEHGHLQVKDSTFWCYVIPSTQLGRIQLLAAFGHKEGIEREELLEFINSINQKYIMVRITLMDGGVIHFDHDISIHGGILKKTLVQTTKRFLSIPGQIFNENDRGIF